MAVDYTTAETVNVEEGVYSADYNKLALAFNDRLKNGVADPTWRLLWYAHSLVRGMRNPNGFNYAPEDEWWKRSVWHYMADSGSGGAGRR
jgi:hypothetical protein